jgi:hypothetical protein
VPLALTEKLADPPSMTETGAGCCVTAGAVAEGAGGLTAPLPEPPPPQADTLTASKSASAIGLAADLQSNAAIGIPFFPCCAARASLRKVQRYSVAFGKTTHICGGIAARQAHV